MEYTKFFSERCAQIEFSGIRKVYERAARMNSAIDLSIGQPDYDAPVALQEAAIAAIRQGGNRYTTTAGLPALRDKIAGRLNAAYGADVSVLISSGVSGGLLLSLLVCVADGAEVIYLDPYFVSYPQLVRMVGGTPAPVSSYPDFRCPAPAIDAAVTPRTRAILINSPGNPTGRVWTDAEVQAVCDVARRRDLLIISDEIYDELCYDGPNPTPMNHAPERTILLRGFGKTYGITGWRMGYVAAARPLIDEMLKMQQYTFVCAPSIAQHAMVSGLDLDVSNHRRDYTGKRDLVTRLLGEAFECVRPSGGFYIFPKAPAGYENATAFCEAAAAREVLIIPGRVFSSRDTHFRVSYAAPDDALERGCRILCELARR